MIRGTTPEFTFKLPFDTSKIKSLYVSFATQGDSVIVEKTVADCTLSGKTVKAKLTQAETLKFRVDGLIQIQLRLLTTDGEAMATRIYTVGVDKILKDGVIE